MRSTLRKVCAAGLLLGAAFGSRASELPSNKMVTTGWLRSNITATNIAILDIRESQKDFTKSHIPGAERFSVDKIRDQDNKLRIKLLEQELSVAGIDTNSVVIIYSNNTDYTSYYLVWALDVAGHKRSAILEGGFEKWNNESRPVTQETETIKRSHYHCSSQNMLGAKALPDDLSRITKGKTLIVDASQVPVIALGVDGVVMRSWNLDIDTTGFFRDATYLQKAYESQGVTPDKIIVVASNEKESGTVTYFMLRYVLGFNKVKYFDGDYGAWVSQLKVPSDSSTQEARQTSRY